MAATAAGKRLTEAHRLAQARLGAKTIRELLASWPLLDPAALDATTIQWLRVVTPIVQLRRGNSANLAANYLTTFRALELGTSKGFTPVLDQRVTPKQLATSLTVTGPVALKQAMTRGLSLAKAAEVARVGSARAGMRHVLNGGRDTTIASVNADARAVGWARVTSGHPCHFCALIASRGPVYSKETVDFQAHDACSCSGEPLYSRDAEWPPGARQYQELWKQAKTMDGDTDIAFRQLVEDRAT